MMRGHRFGSPGRLPKEIMMLTPVVPVILAAILSLGTKPASPGPTDVTLVLQESKKDSVLYQKLHGPKPGYHDLLIRELAFDDFVFEADLRGSPAVTHFGLVFRCQDHANLYRLVLRPRTKDLRVEKVIQGKSDYASTSHVSFPFTSNCWYHVRLAARGLHVEVQIDGKQVYAGEGFTELARGLAGVTVYDPVAAEFDNIRISNANGKKLLFQDDFNHGGLDLWVAAGLEGVRGEWGIQPKIKKLASRNDIVVHHAIQAGPPMGRNQSMFEFPGITKLRDGQLLTLFIEENQHGTPPWAAMPSCGKLWLARSTDLGRTWSQPMLFLDTPLDDRHAYTLQLANGELLGFFWVQPVAIGLDGLFNYVTVSHDGGLTWEDPRRFRTGRRTGSPSTRPTVEGGVSLTVPPVVLPDGTLAMPVHGVLPGKRPPSEIGILRSRDHGRTWGNYTTIAFDPEGSVCFVEPALVRLTSGKWIVVSRTEIPITRGTTHPYTLGPTMICTSTDEGRTWSKPARLPLDFTWSGSTNPFILQTRTGVVVFAVNTGTAFSYDDGRTWVPQEINLGYYPNLVEISPGTLASLACGMSGQVFSLTQPRPGVPPPPGPPTPLQHISPLVPAARSTAPVAKLQDTSGMFRAIRVRQARQPRASPLLAQPSLPLLAVARTMTERDGVIAVVRRDTDGQWLPPLIAAASPAIVGDPVLAQSRDGTILCIFPTGPESDRRMMLTTSLDGGATWTTPTAMAVEGASPTVCMTSPPVEDADGTWLVAALFGGPGAGLRAGVFRSHHDGRTWRLQAKCLPPTGVKRWVEPSFVLSRDGRWVVLARETDASDSGRKIVVTASGDQGKTWCKSRDTGMKGCRPEIVELLDELFLVVAEGDEGQLETALTWDDLSHCVVRNLSCGYCVRVNGWKCLARGSGVDLAGEFNNLAQVPLLAREIAVARQKATVRLPASHPAFRFRGTWKGVEERPGERAKTSSESTASFEIEFEGPVGLLVHDVTPEGRLLGVSIDGKEYPPVDLMGSAKTGVSTCLASDLGLGWHKATLRPLLPWRPGSMTVRALEVAQSK
jgi:hypothetical protein